MTIIISEKLKAVNKEGETPTVSSLGNALSNLETLQIRPLQARGDFERTVNCYPGSITVIKEAGAEQLRNALLAGSVHLRFGKDEVHPSEVQLVQTNEQLLKAESVEQFLRVSSVPDGDIPNLLRVLGLQNAGSIAPRELSSSPIKRLSIGCALYSRARILLFDRPFSGSEGIVKESLARLILSICELSQRIVIVTGENNLPEAWRTSAQVLVQDLGRGHLSLPKQQAADPNGVETAARNLMQASLLVEQRATDLITRPQMIRSQLRPKQSETVQSEAIANPNANLQAAADLISGALERTSRSAETAPVGGLGVSLESPHNEYRRVKSGDLTRVRSKDRFFNSPVGESLREVFRALKQSLKEQNAESFLPRSARLQATIDRKELQLGVVVFVLAVGFLCLLRWWSF